MMNTHHWILCFGVIIFGFTPFRLTAQESGTEKSQLFRPAMYFGKLGGTGLVQVIASYTDRSAIPGTVVVSMGRSKEKCSFPSVVSTGGPGNQTVKSVEIDSSSKNVVSSRCWYVLVDDEVVASGVLRRPWTYFDDLLVRRDPKFIEMLMSQSLEK
jgi:hypothetical protein